jgi:hypothetical protein
MEMEAIVKHRDIGYGIDNRDALRELATSALIYQDEARNS